MKRKTSISRNLYIFTTKLFDDIDILNPTNY